MIDIDSATLRFSDNAGVYDFSLSVPPGVIFGLIGPSGCGKTTTVRMALGIYRPDSGTVRVMGKDPRHFGNRLRERIGYMPQQFVLYPNLTAIENLRFVSSLYGMTWPTRGSRLRDVLEFVELTEARNRLTSKLSGGMQRRLALASSMVHNPVVLFADEPTAGIDPVLRAKFWDDFRRLRDEGHTLFITTQYVGEAAYCDYVGVMREGRLLVLDTPEKLRHRALGGEIVELTVSPENVITAMEALNHLTMVREVYHRPDHGNTGILHIYVEEASDALPALFSFFRDEYPSINIHAAEEYVPPFDDIFIRLMEQAESDQQAQVVSNA